ncbi:hypothetical protein K443DRAFT_134067 [Laccaria amethystina LaAM-08-1]|uniref:Uncharacterized protein n=1 Tax=Laccaria amethystina LaAM-08-1 TaxID=1095629 RepID=A0A0C9XKJ9_9AGAR|nr:hypothetical protein K443DRAFT_134067 [Laccaria amethystina LaAM-08-1]
MQTETGLKTAKNREKPDFTSAAYNTICTALAAAEDTTKEAIAMHLSKAWDVNNNTKKGTWALQLMEDQEAEAEARHTLETEEQNEQVERRKEEEAEGKVKVKKRPKLKDFVIKKPVWDTTQLCPSWFTIHKLKDPNYVELHYFTLEGCMEAAKQDCTITQDAFMFAKLDNTLLLKLMALFKPSNKEFQMSIARATLLHHLGKTSWPDQYVVALVEFYLDQS